LLHIAYQPARFAQLIGKTTTTVAFYDLRIHLIDVQTRQNVLVQFSAPLSTHLADNDVRRDILCRTTAIPRARSRVQALDHRLNLPQALIITLKLAAQLQIISRSQQVKMKPAHVTRSQPYLVACQ